MPIFHEFPYGNTHDQNYDWILQVVKDFQDKYNGIDDALNMALEAIKKAKDGSLEEMDEALSNALEAVNTALENAKGSILNDKQDALSAISESATSALADIYNNKQDALSAISEEKTGALSAIDESLQEALESLQTSLETAYSALQTAEQAVIGRVTTLLETLPSDSTELLSMYQIIMSVLNNNWTYTAVWNNGYWQVPNYGVTVDNTYLYSDEAVSGGIAGRRMKVHCETGYIIYQIVYMTGTSGDYETHNMTITDNQNYDDSFPLNAKLFSIVIRKSDSSTITAYDVQGNVTIEWPMNSVEVPTMIAYVESTTTASQAHEVGTASEFFMLNGYLYQALEDIAQYGTIVTSGSGQNAQAILVMDKIAELKNAISGFKYELTIDGNINASGELNTGSTGTCKCSDFISADSDCTISLVDYESRSWASACSYYNENKEFISNAGMITGNAIIQNIPSQTKFVRLTSVITGRNPVAYIIKQRMIENSVNANAEEIKTIKSTAIYNDDLNKIIGVNKFNKNTVELNKEIYADGSLSSKENSAASDYIYVHDTETVYLKNLPVYENASTERFFAFYDESKSVISSGNTISKLVDSINITVPNGAYYFRFSVYQRVQNSELPIDYDNVMVTLTPYVGRFAPYSILIDKIKGFPIKAEISTKGAKVVIFGDSITETATMNDDGSNYVEGTRSNWPYIANKYMEWGSFINYAKTGASYKDAGASSEFRQSVSNQISLAMNNSDNDDADIIIFSLGTNDGTSNLGSYETAMSKSTLESLDRSLLYEALRYAYWTVRQKYKNAICFSAIPIQRADIEPPTELYEAIEKMAKRYNFIVIYAAWQSGIIKENNVWGSNGNDLYDGLHPNTTGQIKMAELYSDVIKRNYLKT